MNTMKYYLDISYIIKIKPKYYYVFFMNQHLYLKKKLIFVYEKSNYLQ